MKDPTIYKLENLINSTVRLLHDGTAVVINHDVVEATINGRVVPARPSGYPSWRYRLKAAWLVFTGRADAVIWPEGQ